jgi:hypothetical protein
MSRERFNVFAYYSAQTDDPRKIPGALAMHLWHADEHSMRMDAEIFCRRADIAHITIKDLKLSRTKEYVTAMSQVDAWLEEGRVHERKLKHPY